MRDTSRSSHLQSSVAIGLMILASSPQPVAAAAPSFRVEQEPPHIEYRTFEPGHPPPILQQSPGVEAAFCQSGFEGFATLAAATPRFTAGLGPVRITSVELVTRLRIIVWTPDGGPPEYLAHEETHRAIAEHYYRRAGDIARRLTQHWAGRKLALPRKTQAALDDALRNVRGQIAADFLRETQDRCEFAQDRFDTITDHGREPIANPEAMARALADEEHHWAAGAKSP